MFELTNEQRKCFAIPPVLSTWEKIEVKASRNDCVIYAYIDGQKIVKVIQVSDMLGRERYYEYTLDQPISDDRTKILPKTSKGKSQTFTSSNILNKTPIGMTISFNHGYVHVFNSTTDQDFYHTSYNAERPETLQDFSKWVVDWCQNTREKELADIIEFSKRTKIHQKFKEGDFFRYRINRNLFGYGRILVDYAQMRKDGIPFWDVFFGKPLCVAVYHIATEDKTITPKQLVNLQMLPSQMIMDNIFYYGECEIIGNIPIVSDEDNYTIHYGRSIDARTRNYICYQNGKAYVTVKYEEELPLCSDDTVDDFRCSSIGLYLNITLPILLECIKEKSNEPYWNMIPTCRANEDLRNPKFAKKLEQVKKQMGIK